VRTVLRGACRGPGMQQRTPSLGRRTLRLVSPHTLPDSLVSKLKAKKDYEQNKEGKRSTENAARNSERMVAGEPRSSQRSQSVNASWSVSFVGMAPAGSLKIYRVSEEEDRGCRSKMKLIIEERKPEHIDWGRLGA
jgi:hypothetical protein